ncbi:hypothetical protein VTJ49DRAFT_6299 [Mycothermus thermophilus]|uniref:Ecp2 effector protein-like domain-containing protein n=1 Tax=Humicola insolens TaxID=85995 RepID=A0ABR3V216_HUMIN
MHLSSLLTAITATVAVGVTAVSAPDHTLASRQPDEPINYCYLTAFDDEISDGGALISDCQKLADSLKGTSHKEVDSRDRHYATYGTCTFVLKRSPYDSYNNTAVVGDQDVKDLVRASIERYSHEGHVKVRGLMRCNGGESYILWRIGPVS